MTPREKKRDDGVGEREDKKKDLEFALELGNFNDQGHKTSGNRSICLTASLCYPAKIIRSQENEIE